MKNKIKLIAICLMSIFLFTGCASLNKWSKNWESELGNGLNRVVKVYSIDGKLLETYEGKIDIDYEDNRVLFQIDGGNRIAIYGETAIVVVEEK